MTALYWIVAGLMAAAVAVQAAQPKKTVAEAVGGLIGLAVGVTNVALLVIAALAR